MKKGKKLFVILLISDAPLMISALEVLHNVRRPMGYVNSSQKNLPK